MSRRIIPAYTSKPLLGLLQAIRPQKPADMCLEKVASLACKLEKIITIICQSQAKLHQGAPNLYFRDLEIDLASLQATFLP